MPIAVSDILFIFDQVDRAAIAGVVLAHSAFELGVPQADLGAFFIEAVITAGKVEAVRGKCAGLNLYGGQFRANSPRNDASMEDMSLNGKGAFTSDRFNFAGGDYSFNEKRTPSRPSASIVCLTRSLRRITAVSVSSNSSHCASTPRSMIKRLRVESSWLS